MDGIDLLLSIIPALGKFARSLCGILAGAGTGRTDSHLGLHVERYPAKRRESHRHFCAAPSCLIERWADRAENEQFPCTRARRRQGGGRGGSVLVRVRGGVLCSS